MKFTLQIKLRKLLLAAAGVLSATSFVQPANAASNETDFAARATKLQSQLKSMAPSEAMNARQRLLNGMLPPFANAFAKTGPGFANSFANVW